MTALAAHPLRLMALLLCLACPALGADDGSPPQETETPAAPDGAAEVARSLFLQGRRLLDAGRPAEACVVLNRSQELSPAVGTLLNLGLCAREGGSLARALVRYREAERAALAANDQGRAELAAAEVRSLEPLVAWLRLIFVVQPDAAMEIDLDGAALPREEWTAEFPIEPGPHVLVARSPAKVSFTEKMVLRAGAPSVVVVPRLAEARAPPPSQLRSIPRPQAADASRSPGTRRVIAVVVGGLGVASLVASAAFAVSAKSAFAESAPHCSATDVCDETGLGSRAAASARATRATVAGAIGLGASVAGVVLWIAGPGKDTRTPRVGVGIDGVALAGCF